MDQVRAGKGFEIFEVLVNGGGHLVRRGGKQNMANPGPNRGGSIRANPERHYGRGLEREQQAFDILRIADAVVEEVPIHSIDASIRGMAAGATLPSLETERAIVEKHLPPAGRAWARNWS